MACRTDELREKAVISICDGGCLGYITGYDIDVPCGKICAVFVGGSRSFFGIKNSRRCDGETRIPWDKITQIGKDTILVDVKSDVADCECRSDGECRSRKWWR